MATVAEQLRAAREARGMSLNQVADITKMRADHIRAIEEGNYDVFMAPVFIRGFVRTYVRLLKLNEASVMAALDTELKGTEKFSELPPLTKQRRSVLDVVMLQLSKLNWNIVLPIALAALLILTSMYGYRFWRRHANRNPLADLGPGLYQAKPEMTDLYITVTTNAVRRP